MKLKHIFLILTALAVAGCSSKFLKVEDPTVLAPNEEFDKAVTIVVPETPPEAPAEASPEPASPPTGATSPEARPASPQKREKKVAKTAKPAKILKHEPSLEDGGTFNGRRPKVDPFWVGESVVLDVSYFKVSAGSLTLKVGPFAEVNGRKAYNFVTEIQTYPTFSSLVYAVDDRAVTLVDYDLLIPRVFTLHVKETSQLREARSYFDFEKLEARYWEKKVTKKDGAEEKRQQWNILPYSQNVFSAIFYMRLFAWETGKEYAFRVADDEQNLVFKGTALRRETVSTDLGPRKAVVVKAEVMTKGIFKPVGDILIWLSDDDRKLVLRIESKIKIGTLVAEAVRINPGRAP